MPKETTMADTPQTDGPQREEEPDRGNQSGTATAPAKPRSAKKRASQPKPPQPLPPWKVLLHNDNKNDAFFVVSTIMELTPLNEQDSMLRMKEAHETGVALLLVTHKERAELYKDQFESKGLTVTLEPAE
jgi:ATP-dependent Clp protease adaptor protein ClpS